MYPQINPVRNFHEVSPSSQKLLRVINPTKVGQSIISHGIKKNVLLCISFLILTLMVQQSLVHTKKEVANVAEAVVQPVLTHLSLAPEINALAYLVRFLGETKTILLSRDSFKPLPPASLTKILTSVIAREELASADQIIFTAHAKGIAEKRSSVIREESFARDDAVGFAIVGSANDAAMALAEAVGRKMGGESYQDRLILFRKSMIEKARAIGLFNSTFQNPTGLDETAHYSTAEDLATLAEYVWMYHSDIWNISRTLEFSATSLQGHLSTMVTTNELLREFPALLGGKTGLTDSAKGTLILLYPVKNNEVVVIVILGSEDRFGDGRKLIQWLENSF